MRFSSLSFLLLIIAAQGATFTERSIYGTVSDSSSGEPIVGVNIVILETGEGTSSNAQGEFEFTLLGGGNYTIEFSHIGYQRKTVPGIRVSPGRPTRIDIGLQESYLEFDPVEILGMRFRQSQDDSRTSMINLRPGSAQILPGAVEDVMRTLQAMPGIVTRSDFSSQLVVRGSGPDQNLIVMDDIEVFNPYRLYGLISMFNPETISNISLDTGGFPVRYGDRLSAVLNVSNREGRRDRPIEGNVNTNITNANIILEGRMPGVDGSYLLSVRRTYYDLIAGPVARSMDLVKDDVAFPNFTDFQTRITLGPYDNHLFYINTLNSRDAVNLISGERRPTVDSIAIVDQTDHSIFGVAWHYTPSNNVYSKFTLSRYRNIGDSDFQGSFLDPTVDRDGISGSRDSRFYELDISSLYDFEKISLSQEISYAAEKYEIRSGTGGDFLRTKLIWKANIGQRLREMLEEFEIPLIDRFTQQRRYLRLFAYLENKWRVTDRFTIEPGFRMDYYTILEDIYLSPRISASFALDEKSTVRASVGRFLQSPGYEKIFGQTQFFDLTDRESVARLKPEEAIHYVAGIDRWLANTLYLRMEAYLKDFNNLIAVDRVPGTRYIAEPIPGRDHRYPEAWSEPFPIEVDSVTINPNNDASGRSYGLEFFLEKPPSDIADPISGWISYAFAIANRSQYGRTLPFDFDQRHTINIVLNYRVSRVFEIGTRWRYGSGFPFTPGIGLRPRISRGEEDGERVHELQTDSNGRVLFNIDRGDFSNRNSARLPEYSRIDVRMNWYTSLWGLNWLFYLDVINVLNRKNVIGYNYVIEETRMHRRAINMFPIIPTFGFSFQF